MTTDIIFDRLIELLDTKIVGKYINGSIYYNSERCQEISNILNNNHSMVNLKRNGTSVLMLACYYERLGFNSSIIKLLLELSADPNELDGNKNTPLMMLLTRHRIASTNSYTIKTLIEHNTDTNVINNQGSTTLMLASQCDISHKLGIMKLLIKSCNNINHQCNLGETALTVADELPVIKLLLDNGADINHKNIYHETLLMKICKRWCTTDNLIIKFLLDNGADPEIISDTGATALMYLCDNYFELRYDNIDIIMYLIHKSKNVIVKKDVDNKTALDYYNKYHNKILDTDRLEYLAGHKVSTMTKSANKV